MTTVKPIAEALSLLLSWKTPYVVGIDVGATNTRVAVAPISSPASDYTVLATFECDDATKLADSLAALAAQLPDSLPPAAGCGIDAAGPVEDNGRTVRITNWPADHNCVIDSSLLTPRLCPRGKTALLNDLEACCYGIAALSAASRLTEYFTPLTGAAEPAPVPPSLPLRRHLILAMGTGLGVGMLMDDRETGTFRVVPTEIGHATATRAGKKSPYAERDGEFLEWLGEKLYGGEFSPEFEDVCSGRGLVAAYNFTSKGKELTAKEIAQKAISGDKEAEEAMLLHYRFLLRDAQQMTVSLQTKSVLLCGDNQVHNAEFVLKKAAELHKEFLDHPKEKSLQWLSSVPVFAQTKHVNANMIGCVAIAEKIGK